MTLGNRRDQRVSICLEYARVNNAREVIPAALGRSLTVLSD